MSQALRVGLHITPDDPYWVLVREAVYQRAEQCAIQLISVDVPGPRGLADQSQVNWVEELLAQEFDAMISKDLPLKLCLRILELGLPIIYASEVDFYHPRFVSPVTLYKARRMQKPHLPLKNLLDEFFLLYRVSIGQTVGLCHSVGMR